MSPLAARPSLVGLVGLVDRDGEMVSRFCVGGGAASSKAIAAILFEPSGNKRGPPPRLMNMDEDMDIDARLVAAARSGDSDAVSRLFERHWIDAWRLARSITGSEATADDVAQEAIVKAMSSLQSLRDTSSFRSWLHQIVYRTALDELRRGKRVVAVADPLPPQEEATGSGSDLDSALELLAALSPERRAALVLHHCLDYSLVEVAQILDVPLGTVQSRTSRGLSQLRAHLGGKGQ